MSYQSKNKYPSRTRFSRRPRYAKSAISDFHIVVGALLILVVSGVIYLLKISLATAVFVSGGVVVLSIFGILSFVFIRAQLKWRRNKALSAAHIDQMRGLDFEQYLQSLLTFKGFSHVMVTQESGDFGADLIADFAGEKYAIQAKQYNSWKEVGVEAIYQVLGGKDYYGCTKTMVISTGHFTKPAHELAGKTKTELIGREELADWITEFNRSR